MCESTVLTIVLQAPALLYGHPCMRLRTGERRRQMVSLAVNLKARLDLASNSVMLKDGMGRSYRPVGSLQVFNMPSLLRSSMS